MCIAVGVVLWEVALLVYVVQGMPVEAVPGEYGDLYVRSTPMSPEAWEQMKQLFRMVMGGAIV